MAEAQVDPTQLLRQALIVCGVANDAYQNVIINNEGFTSIADFAELTYDEIDHMAKNLASRRNVNDRAILGAMVIKKLKALSYWAKDQIMEFTATLDDRQVHGVDLIGFDTEGRIADFTVMVRPKSALDALIAHMVAALNSDSSAT